MLMLYGVYGMNTKTKMGRKKDENLYFNKH